MEVEIASREIRLSIEENSISHKIVDNFCQKNFSNLLKLSNTFVVYHKEDELAKKRYFLNWVYTAYKKKKKSIRANFLKQLQANGHLPIRISIRSKNRVLHGLKVMIMFPEKNVLRLSIDSVNSVPVTYFKHIFKKSLITSRDSIIDIKTTVSSIVELKKVLDREKILGLPVTFVYNERIIGNLFEKLDAKLKQKTKRSGKKYSNNHKYKSKYKERRANHTSVFSELEIIDNSYKVLECVKGDCQNTIKKRYLQLVKEFHPDRVYGKEQGIIDHYTKKFQEISNAYSVIQQSINKVA